MNEIYCQLCNVNVFNYHMELHVGGKKHKARHSKETFEQEIARSVVLQGFNPESPLKFSELQEIFQPFGYIEGFRRTHEESREVNVRFYNNRDAKKALNAGRFVFFRNEKFQIYKKFHSEQERDENVNCPPPPEISERRQALLPPPSQGIDPTYATSSQLIQQAHSDAYVKDWKIKYRNAEYQDTRNMDRTVQVDTREKVAKHDLEDRYQNSAYRSNELVDSRNIYPNFGSRESIMHDSRTMERREFDTEHRTSNHEIDNQVLMNSPFSQRTLKGASGVQDYRYQAVDRSRMPVESQNHPLPFHQSDGRDQMMSESITHLPTLSKYVPGFGTQPVGRNQVVSTSLFHGEDIDDRRNEAVVQSANNQIYLPDSHYHDPHQPGGPIRNHRSRSRDVIAQVQASRYQTRTDLDSQGSRNTMPDYNRRLKDGVEDSHIRSSQGSRNPVSDYNRPRDVIEDNHIRATQGPRVPIPEYIRAREGADDSHNRKTTQGPRNPVLDYNRPRDVVEDNHIRTTQGSRAPIPEYRSREGTNDSHNMKITQGLRNSESNYIRPKDVADDSRNRTTQGSRNLLPDYKRPRDIVEDSHISLSQGLRNSESDYKRPRNAVEDSHIRSTQGPRNSEPDYQRPRDAVEDSHIRSTQGLKNSEPDYKRPRDVVEDSHTRSTQCPRNSEPDYKRPRDAVEDSHKRLTQGLRNSEPDYKRPRDAVEDSHTRSTQGLRNSESDYKRPRDAVEDSHIRSTQGPRNSELDYKRPRDLVDDSHIRSTQGPRNSEPDYKRAREGVVDDHHRKSSENHKHSVTDYSRSRDGVDNTRTRKSSQSSRSTLPDYSRPMEITGNGDVATHRTCMLRPAYLKQASDTRTQEKEICPVRIPTSSVKENNDSSRRDTSKSKSIAKIMLSVDLKGSFEQQLASLMYELRRFDYDSMKVNQAHADIERALQNEYPGCRILLCGSSMTGLSLSEAKANFYLEFTAENKNKVAVGSTAEEGRREKNASRIAAEILNMNKAFAHVRPFPNQRSPIVELHHIATRISVHISFKTWTMAKDELLKFLISTDERLMPIFMFIKYWATVHMDNVGKNKHSKYYLMLLIIFYLQRLPKPILPPIRFLQKDSSYDKFADGWNIGFNNSVHNVPKNENTSPIKTLLEGFFEFYSKFKFEDFIISPFVGDAIPSHVFLEAHQLPPTFDVYKENLLTKSKGSFQINKFMNVQDPFEHNYNASLHLNLEVRNLFKTKCKSTLSLFQECHRTDKKKGLLLNKFFICDKTKPSVKNKGVYIISIHLPMDKQVSVSEECAMLTYVRLNKLLVNMLTDVLKSKFTCVKDIKYTAEGALCSPEAKYTCTLYFNLWSSRSSNQSQKSDSNSIIERETSLSNKIIDSLYRNQKPACPILMFNLDACIKIDPKLIYLNFTCDDTFSETFQEFYRVCGPIFEHAVKRLAERIDDR